MFSRTRRSLKRRMDEAIAPYREGISDAISVYQDVKDIVSPDPAPMPRYSKKSKSGSRRRSYRSKNIVPYNPYVEKKYTSVNATGQNASTSWQFVLLNGVAQGDDYNTRDGRAVASKSLNGQLWARFNASATNSVLRIVIFHDRQTNGAAPTISDVIQYGNVVLSSYNPDLLGRRFTILQDKIIALNASNSARTFTFYNNLSSKKYITTFNNTTSAVASISIGSIYMIYITNEATYVPSFDYQINYRFVDL